MDGRPGVRVLAAARDASLAVLLLGGLVALQWADPEQVAPVELGLSLLAAVAGGRVARDLGLPRVLGWLSVGVLLGPSASTLVARVWPAWPMADGLLGPGVLPIAASASQVALGVAMVWLGAQLDVRRLGRGLPAVAGLLLGHVVAVGAVAALLARFALDGAALAAGLPSDPVDIAGAGVTVAGTSALLVAAVLRDDRADGDVTRTILWLAVLGELASLVALVALVAGTPGAWSGLLLAPPGTPSWVLFTSFVGGLTGAILAAGATWIGPARGPWLAVTSAVAALAAVQVGLSPALVGLVAGVVVAHAAPSDRGVALDLAGGAAMLVLFTAAGARLPLVDLVASIPGATLLVVLRLLLVVSAALAVARLVRAPPELVRYGWTALIASGIPVAGLVPWRALDLTDDAVRVTAVLWGMAAVNGLLGALAVHLAVGFARETETTRGQEDASYEAIVGPPPVEPTRLPEGPVREHVEDLAGDLRALVRELRAGELRRWSDATREYLELLRKEIIRHHRRVSAIAHADEPRDVALRAARVEFTERARALVFDHATRLARVPWKPTELVDLLDRVAQGSPEHVEVPPIGAGGGFVGAFRAFTGLLVGASLRRVAPLRQLLRFHLSGRAPARLEPVAAALVNGELHLAARTHELFFRVLDAYRADDLGDARLEAIREDLADDLRSAREEAEAIAAESEHRLEAALDRLVHDVAVDLLKVGALELPLRARTFDRVARQRDLGVQRLTDGWVASRDGARVRFLALSLELELVGLELEVRDALAEHGSLVARLVRGRGTTQLERVEEALDETLARVEALVAADEPASRVAAALRDEASAFSRVADDAATQADDLRAQLAAQDALAPLLDALTRAGSTLGDRYEVPVGLPEDASWALPPPVDTREVPFREVVLGYIETSVTRDLLGLTQRYALELERAVDVIEDVDRAVGFNAELAAAELAGRGDRPLTGEQRRAIREIVFEGIERNRGALRAVLDVARTWYEAVDQRIQAAVLTDLSALRDRIGDGTFAEVAAERAIVRGADRAGPTTPSLGSRIDRGVRGWLGEAGFAEVRDRLGLVPDEPFEQLTRGHFAPPQPRIQVPLVYRRLFSEQALEAGELVGGREAQADRVRRALEAGEDTRLRTVAVIGPDGVGKPAIVRAALRAMRMRGVHRFDLQGPVSPDEVSAWFERGTVGHVYVVSSFHWLYALRAGGFEPLRRFIEGVLDDGGRNAWVVDADEVVWNFACAAAPLARAFPNVVRIAPLGLTELEQAMLARHAMSGFALSWQGAGEGRALRQHQRTWFRDFHTASGGIARDAMRLWLAAMVEVDVPHRRVVLGPVPQIPTAAMKHLSDRSALGLQVAARQGWVDEPTWARLFQVPPLEARADLVHLVHWGLLAPEGDRFVLPTHLQRSLALQLRERGWLA